jgi:hypothetical protein
MKYKSTNGNVLTIRFKGNKAYIRYEGAARPMIRSAAYIRSLIGKGIFRAIKCNTH